MRYFAYSLLLLVLVPVASAQDPDDGQAPVECEETCQIFDTAPPPCICTLRGGPSTESLEPHAVRARMREAYARSVESVDNYTVVVSTSRTPIPVVQYFEKEMIEGEPVFRQVSPADLAEREAEARGGPTPQQMGEGMAAIFGAVRGRVSASNTPEPPADVDYLPAGTEGLLDILGAIVEGLDGMINALLNPTELTNNQDLVQQILQLDEFWQRAEFKGKETVSMIIPTSPDPTVIPNDTLLVDAYVYTASDLRDVDLGEGSEAYEVLDATVYVGGAFATVPLAVIVHLRDLDSGETIEIKKRDDKFRRAGPMTKPFQIINTISGVSELAGDVTLWIDSILVNEGPPTQEQMALLSQTALDRSRGER